MTLFSTQLLNSPDVKSGSNIKSRFLWCSCCST